MTIIIIAIIIIMATMILMLRIKRVFFYLDGYRFKNATFFFFLSKSVKEM